MNANRFSRLLIRLCWLISLFWLAPAHACQDRSPYAQAVLADQPVAYYQLETDLPEGPIRLKNIAHTKPSPSTAKISPGIKLVGGPPGIAVPVAQFDGSKHIELPINDNPRLDELSIEFWFRSEQLFDQKFWPGSATLVSLATAGPGSSDWVILGGSLTPGSDQGRILVGVGPMGDHDHVLASDTGLNDGQFHHVVWTRTKAGKNTLFVDGQACASDQDNGGPISNMRPIQIGGEQFEPGGSQFQGELGGLAIYPRALDAKQIQRHFMVGSLDPRLPPAVDRSIDFKSEILPLFQKRCAQCHAGGKDKGGLSLATRARAIDGGDSGPALIPGQSGKSLLIRLIAAMDEERAMPPDDEPLSAEQIGIIRAWIDQGADWPADLEEVDPKITRAREHWSFKSISRPELPQTDHANWAQTPIDLFILSSLNANHLKPSVTASKTTLLRRVTFDLTGLPPTPQEIQAYLTDEHPAAYQRVVDRLLASPAHGEYFARHWLDVVRYADSGGYETDIFYEQAWRYRDFIVQSFNAGKPYNRFLMEQIAGDELWPDQAEAMQSALAVWTLGEWQNALDAFPEELEYTRRTDQVITLSESMLGLTIGCANCHNHKYDPISQRDYFGLEAIFAASETWDPSTGQKAWIKGQRNAHRILRHAEIPTPIHLLTRGELKKPRGLVSPALPAFLSQTEAPPSGSDENLRRRAYLANWTVSPRHPLTARVMANRGWQWLFGRGIVATPNDFGTQGQPPSHPELLDWLASELIESGWDLKHLVRLIVLSATYQQTTGRTPEALSLDPQNLWLSSFPGKRLQAESIWDHLHAAAGLLNRKAGGPPFVPKLSDEELLGIYDLESRPDKKWPITPDQHRRGLYLLNRRSFRFPFFEAFDPPTNSTSCPIRQTTTVPAQALTLLNNSRVSELASSMADRLSRETGNVPNQIRLAWLLAYSRQPTQAERELAEEFLAEAALTHQREGTPQPGHAALTELCMALMNSSEFLYTY